MFEEYTEVRVIKLEESNREYYGTDDIKHAPEIGDTGIIVDVTMNENTNDAVYWVENVNSDGYTVWLAEFVESEIEPYTRDD